MKKRILALLLTGCMTLFMMACGSTDDKKADNTGGVAGDTSIYPEEKVLIGVELYDLTDSETIQMKEYFDYLTETMNVEFKYSEAISDADAEMDFIEECAVAGAQAFIGKYNVSGAEQVAKVIEYGMYYYGQAESEEIYNEFKEDPLYLGSISLGESDYLSGYEMGAWCKEQGFDKVIYSNGGANFGIQMFIDRQKGFLDGLGDGIEVITVSGFPGDQFYADQEAALATEGVDAVATSINGMDYWAQPIDSAGLTDKVALTTMGLVDEKMTNAFTDGTIAMLTCGGTIQRYGLAVGMLCNAVDGNADALKKDGLATNDEVSIWRVETAEECQKLQEIQSGERIFTVEDVLSLSVNVNADANAQTLTDLLKKAELENLLQ